ncbi:MAG TPA: hypothetical protein VNO55_17955 [Polyangia bacterium]|nr:hypothetical protein [Polyangia bacterium]
MKDRIAILSVLAIAGMLGANRAASAASAAADADAGATAPTVARATDAAAPAPPRWTVRGETSLVGMHDSWASLPSPELGITVARDLTRRVSVEVTGSVRFPGGNYHDSYSLLGVGRLAVLQSSNRAHALTVAGGPFLAINDWAHGTLPFAHAELAYQYRTSWGPTVLAGVGTNVALASSSYVRTDDPFKDCHGDSVSFCIDLGPDAHDLHTGDADVHLRVGAGWQF